MKCPRLVLCLGRTQKPLITLALLDFPEETFQNFENFVTQCGKRLQTKRLGYLAAWVSVGHAWYLKDEKDLIT